MRAAAILIACAIALFASAALAAEKREITKEMALKAVAAFREADPMSEDALGYAAILITFVEEDKTLRFKLTPKVVPFLSAKAVSQHHKSILLGAYAAGNVQGCLLRGDRTDDPYEIFK